MIHPIDDLDDPRVAGYRNIPDPELLRAHGVFVAEGRQVVRHLLASGRFRTRSVLVSPAALEGLRDVLDARARLPVYVMSVERLAALVGFNMHRGCLAMTPHLPARDLDDALASLRPGTTVALMLGHEGDGLTEGAILAADERVRSALRTAVDSLNVATAAAIALHACRHHLGWPSSAAT